MRHTFRRAEIGFLLFVLLPFAASGQGNQRSGEAGATRSGLSVSSWPFYRGDLRNTGYSALGQSGGKPWTRATTWKDFWGSPGFGSDETLYIIADGLYAYDSRTGSEKWHFYLSSPDGAGLAVGQDGLVYLTAVDTTGTILYAVDAHTGEQRWNFKISKRLTRLNLPTVGSDGTVYIATGGLGPVSEDNTLYALNGRTGKQHWSLPLSERCDSAPLIGLDGRVFCLSKDATLTSVDPVTGKADWSFHEAGWVAWSAAGMDDAGMIYLALAHLTNKQKDQWEGELVAVDSKQGSVAWRHSYDKGLGTPSLGKDGTIYAGSNDNLYAFNGKTGDQIWAFPTHGSPVTSPAITPDGMLYCCSMDGNVYAIKAETGEKVWQTQAGHKHLSAPVVNATGLVFITSSNQNIYAIRASDGKVSTEVIAP